MKKKILSIILVMIMIMGMLQLSVITASAAEGLSDDCTHIDADKNNKCDICEADLYVYRSWDAENKTVVEILKKIPDDAVQTADDQDINFGSGYYIISTDCESINCTVSGTNENPTILILMDDKKFTSHNEIAVSEGNALYIYGQANDTGKIYAYDGIGGGYKGDGGNINIYGGIVNAKSKSFGAGIGGGENGNSGDISIYGGIVNAESGNLGAGIGGGDNGNSENINIYGGTVNAASESYGAGIGSGYQGISGNITICNATVNAVSGGTIDDETGEIVTILSEGFGAGIGGGYFCGAGVISITDSIVSAIGGDMDGAGIGCGYMGSGGKITISGGSVTASARYLGSAGIGATSSITSSTEHGTLAITPHTKVRAGTEAPGSTKTVEEYMADRDPYVYIGHVFDDIYRDNGNFTHSRKCYDCDTYDEPMKHTYVNGVCDKCGARHPHECSGKHIDKNATDNYCDVCDRELYISRSPSESGIYSELISIPQDAISITNQKYLNPGWYVVDHDVEISNCIDVRGTSGDPTYIVLKDGCTLNATGGIKVKELQKLFIYGQHEGSGKIVATGGYNCAGIGGDSDSDCGTVIIHGGSIEAIGGENAAGIGGGINHNGGTIIMNGGSVIAQSADGAGIGGGHGCKNHGEFIVADSMNIKAGDTEADNSVSAEEYRTNRNHCVYIAVGHIHDFTGDYIDNEDGTHSRKCSGCDEYGAPERHIYKNNVCVCGKEIPQGSFVYIDENGSEQITENYIAASSVETVDDYSFEAGKWYVVEGIFTVNNRIENNAPSDKPAHIILGYGAVLQASQGIHNPVGKGLIIYTHSLNVPGIIIAGATDQNNPHAGIGGNDKESGGDLIVCSGIINATGGLFGGAGIGGGYGSDGGNITIKGGDVTASGGYDNGGAGIGGGYNGEGGNITITGGDIIAQGHFSAAIGAGCGCNNHGTLTFGSGLDMFAGNSEEDCSYKLPELYAYSRESYAEIISIPSYTVKHYKQNESKTGYDLAEAETFTGHTGNKTTASFKSYDGFVPLVFEQQTIKKDGSTVVEIYYNKLDYPHEHTYSENWSYDPYYHWHDSICEHSGLTANFAAHSFDDGVTNGNATTYTCACGYQKVVYNTAGDNEGEVVTGISYTGISLTLGSDISINFYMNLTDDARQGGTMTFDIGGRTVTLNGTDAKYNETEKQYYFSMPITALEMAEIVTATFKYKDVDYIQEYSVEDYIEKIVGNSDKYGDKAVMLARKIANYGYYAQIYLASIHTNVEIVDSGDGYDRMIHFGNTETGNYDINIAAAKAALAEYKLTVTGASEDLSLFGTSVYFDSATALNYYVKATGGTQPTATAVNPVTEKNKTVEIKHYKDDIYIVSVKDIIATELADNIVVTVNGTLTITGSVFAYCNSVITAHTFDGATDIDTFAVNAMAAFYEYYISACEYTDMKIYKNGYLYFTCDAPDVKKVCMNLQGLDGARDLSDVGDGIYSDDGYVFNVIGYGKGYVTFTIVGDSTRIVMPSLEISFDESDCAPMLIEITGLTDENYNCKITKLK